MRVAEPVPHETPAQVEHLLTPARLQSLPAGHDDPALDPQRDGTGVAPVREKQGRGYSHSMVPGGLLVTSSTTRLTSRTSLVMRVEIRARTS